MITIQTGSVQSPESPYPWYEIEIRDGAPVIVSDTDGATNFDLSLVTHSVPDFVDLPAPAVSAMADDVAYVILQTGEFVALPYTNGYGLTDDVIQAGMEAELDLKKRIGHAHPDAEIGDVVLSPIRAKLAWYDSDADEFTIREFVER